MPHLGVITDEISEDLEHALAVCRDLGIRDVELRSIWGTSIVEVRDDDLQRVDALLRKDGFSVSGIASPFLKCHIAGDGDAAGRTHSASATTRDDQWDVLARSLEVAHRLDAPPRHQAITRRRPGCSGRRIAQGGTGERGSGHGARAPVDLRRIEDLEDAYRAHAA